MRAVGVNEDCVLRVGVDGMGDSPRLAAFREAVSLLEGLEGVGDVGRGDVG